MLRYQAAAGPEIIAWRDQQLAEERFQLGLMQWISLRAFDHLSLDQNSFSESSKQLREARRSFGDMPLIVLSGGNYAVGMPTSFREKAKDAWFHMHDDLAKLSSRGVHYIVAQAGHYVQLDDPSVVIAAIDAVLADARASNKVEDSNWTSNVHRSLLNACSR